MEISIRLYTQIRLLQRNIKKIVVVYTNDESLTNMSAVGSQALHFVTYEACQKKLNPARAYDPLAHALAGAAAGALAAAATTPLDVCKTVLNTQERSARAAGLGDAARHVLRASGPRGFLKGVQARVLYQMPAAAICWLTYESFKHALAGADDERAPPSAPLACAALRLAAADVPAAPS